MDLWGTYWDSVGSRHQMMRSESAREEDIGLTAERSRSRKSGSVDFSPASNIIDEKLTNGYDLDAEYQAGVPCHFCVQGVTCTVQSTPTTHSHFLRPSH